LYARAALSNCNKLEHEERQTQRTIMYSPLSLSVQIGLVGARNCISSCGCLEESVPLCRSYVCSSRNRGVSKSQVSKLRAEKDQFLPGNVVCHDSIHRPGELISRRK
jgi:hypothetical protein